MTVYSVILDEYDTTAEIRAVFSQEDAAVSYLEQHRPDLTFGQMLSVSAIELDHPESEYRFIRSTMTPPPVSHPVG